MFRTVVQYPRYSTLIYISSRRLSASGSGNTPLPPMGDGDGIPPGPSGVRTLPKLPLPLRPETRPAS